MPGERILVFKSGYDCHPPELHFLWTSEDEKKKEMTRHEYQVKYWITYEKDCNKNKECLVPLNKAESIEAIKYIATHGITEIQQIPIQDKNKLHHTIQMFNQERKKFGKGILMDIE